MQALWQDLVYGARLLRKAPGFTLVAIVSLTLGIGVNTTIFSVINGVMFRPLPYQDPDRLVVMLETQKNQGNSTRMAPTANIVDWKNQSQTLVDIGMVTPGSGPANLTGVGPAERIREQSTSPNLFAVLGVRPVLGRTFSWDDVRGGQRPALLSYEFWKRRFGGDPKVLGLSFFVEGLPRTVIGVLPPEFAILSNRDVDVWQPMDPNHSRWQKRTDQWLIAIGRRKSDVSLAQAQAEMDTIAAGLEQSYPQSNKNIGVRIEPLRGAFSGGAGSFLYPLLGAVGFVLLIACANVANLLLARVTARQKEIAVRASLGASRWRVVRQLLTECVLLALVSGLSGVLLARWGIDLVLALTPERGWSTLPISIDVRVLAFTLGASLLTGLLFGLIPALQASKPDLQQALKSGTAPRLRGSASRFLVAAEVALAMVLLVGAGLMIHSLLRLQRVDPGFDPRNVLTMEIFLSGPNYVRNAPDNMKQVSPQVTAFHRMVLERAGSLPGVESAALVGQLPTGYLEDRTFTILGAPPPAPEQRPGTGYLEASPSFFSTLKIPLRRGRYLEDRDTETAPWVVVVSEAFARSYFRDEDPIGKSIVLRTEPYQVEESVPRQIVGVVGDVKWALAWDTPPTVYASYRQQPNAFPGGRATGHLRQKLVLRFAPGSRGHWTDAVAAVRKTVVELDKDQPVYDVMSLEQILSRSVWMWRFYSQVLGAFATLALLLAAVGIYGVLSYFVGLRTREIGIRMALGATRAEVTRLVLRHGLVLTGIGLVTGIGASLALTRLIARFLFGVKPTDPLTFSLVALLLGWVALLASYVPARKAARVDPLVAVREE